MKIRNDEPSRDTERAPGSRPVWRTRSGLDPGLVALTLLAAVLVVVLAHYLSPVYEGALQWLEETVNAWLGW